jgi:hypothetical protein
MKTFYDIIKDVSNLRWSIVDPEPESFVEVQKAVKLAIPQAHSYIWGLGDFPFKHKKESITLTIGQTSVLAPRGQITSVQIDGDNGILKPIQIDEVDVLKPKRGKPQYYWIEFTDEGATLNFYPQPDKQYLILCRYETNQKARNANGELKANLSEINDTLNLPKDESIEDMYLHCLYTKSMEYLIADSTDENYAPYQKEFDEAYRNLLNLTGIKRNPYLVI